MPGLECRMFIAFFLRFLLWSLILALVASKDDEVCHAQGWNQTIPFRPSDLPGPQLLDTFQDEYVMDLPGKHRQLVQNGEIAQIRSAISGSNTTMSFLPAKVAVLPQLVDRSSIKSMMDILRGYDNYDKDPDTVDGMPTYEIFLASPNLLDATDTVKVLDRDPVEKEKRRKLRQRLRNITDVILAERITPFVRLHYPNVCQRKSKEDRWCTPCFSLIRRYRYPMERISHAPHRDGHALVTVVVSLSDYGTEYSGGLYVMTTLNNTQRGPSSSRRHFLRLHRGDAVVHRSNLLHGVQIYPIENSNLSNNKSNNHTSTVSAERWSWILWYRDSVNCSDHSHEWFVDCIHDDPVCQELHASAMTSGSGKTQGQGSDDKHRLIVQLYQRAAEAGSGTAAIKMARAYLGLLPSNLPRDVAKATKYYQIAISCREPDGYYGMAALWLSEIRDRSDPEFEANQLPEVVKYLELASQLGHPFAMFNLGIVHVYGYGTYPINTTLAAEWFIESGLPEGYFVASFQARSMGRFDLAQLWHDMAIRLGQGAPWRRAARQYTGSGGAAGVDINLPWPPINGRQPPQF